MAFTTIGKKLRVGATIGRFVKSSLWSHMKERKSPIEQRRKAIEHTAKYSKIMLSQLNVETSCTYSGQIRDDRNYFMVCNHMSYLDIVVLSAVRPSVFITSVDMRDTFFLGDIAKLGGSFFVNRRNRKKIKEEVEALTQLVEDGFDVFLFPEGTSSSGMDGVLPFKKSLFRVPHGAQIPIIPICLKYTTIDGAPFSAKNCDQVAWHSDMTFAPHLNQLTQRKKIVVQVDYMDPVESSRFGSHGDLSQHLWEVISERYKSGSS